MAIVTHNRPALRVPRLRAGVPGLRFLVAAAFAVTLTVIAWKTGDWWTIRKPGSVRNLTVARAVLFAMVFGFVYAVPALVRRTTRLGAVVFAGWVAFLGLWLWATWPGVLMPDSVDMMVNSRQGIAYNQFSYLYSLFNLSLLDVVPHVGVLAPIQIGVMAGTMAFASQFLQERRRSLVPVIVMNLVAAISVPVIVDSLMYSRDPLFGVLHVLLALMVARALARRRWPTRNETIGFAALTALLATLRSDGQVLIVVVPVLLFVGLRPPRAQILRAGALLVGALLVLQVVVPATLVKVDRSTIYSFGLRLNPLSRILQTPFYSKDPQADLAELGKVIDVNKARELHTPDEMAIFYSPFWRRETTPAQFDAFNRTADRIIRDNPTTFLASRVETFGAATGLAPAPWHITFTDAITLPLSQRHDRLIGQAHDIGGDMTGLGPARPPLERAYTAQAKLLAPTVIYQGLKFGGTALFWNFLPWMALLTLTLFFWRRLPFEAAFAVVILSRVPLVFLASPSAQFKYYYSVELGGIVLLGLLLARMRREHLRRLVPRRTRPGIPAT